MAQARVKRDASVKRAQGEKNKPGRSLANARASARHKREPLQNESAAPSPADQRRMTEVIKILDREHPDAVCALHHETPWQLLMATILSAQCTDERVNLVTPALFARYPGPAEMARARLPDVEKLIHSTGFFRNKAIGLVEASKAIMQKHGGELPRTLEELTALRGVGRKTANVLLGNAFGIPGLVVDTHVGRLCRRLGFTRSEDPVKIETEMMALVPKDQWTMFSHWLISHGRAICDARKPLCGDCALARLCPKVGVKTQ